MDHFATYWKEIAVVTGGAFALLSAAFDIRDRRTGKFTIWGRVFFVATILTMIGGFYAQWSEDRSAEQRAEQERGAETKLIAQTEKSVHEIARAMEPIETVNLDLRFEIKCDDPRMRRFCAIIRMKEKEYHKQGIFGDIPYDTPPWNLWPDGRFVSNPDIQIYKSGDEIVRDILRSDITRIDNGDTAFEFLCRSGLPFGRGGAFIHVIRERIIIACEIDNITPALNSNLVISAVDLPGSTIVVDDLRDEARPAILRSIIITTQR